MLGRRVSLALFAVAVIGCGGGTDIPVDATPVDAPVDALVIPNLRNPVTLDDATLAAQASGLMGAEGAKNCDRCHAINRSRLHSWLTETTVALEACFTNVRPSTPVEAMAIVDCLREQRGVVTSGWPPAKLGVYATAVDLDWFHFVFNLAFGAEGPAQFALFKGEALMPRGGGPTFTQEEFDVVAEWFARGLPEVNNVIPADQPSGPCVAAISPEVATHISTMRQQGWRAMNAEAGLAMFGCAGAAGPRQCLATYPKPGHQAWSVGWDAIEPSTSIRILRDNAYSSSYWTRGSADGRYVAHGGASVASQTYKSTVIDLMQDREIPAAALYDPAFTPDNTAFMIQGGSAKICEQSLLDSSPQRVAFTEAQCNTTDAIGLYQHIGAARGGDYWAVAGQFVNDNVGHAVTLTDVGANSNSTSKITLTPFVHTGTQFVPHQGIQVATPREGDVVLSPTTKLLVSRMNGGNNSQSGYLMRKMIATPSGTSYVIDTPEIARYCLRGGKVALSYDDRWMVYHHIVESGDWQAMGYPAADDPAWLALRAKGASNIFLVDLLSGVSHRVTTMNPGQYALYPFFRSDGWIYFLIRDDVRNHEYVVASDAALKYEGP